MGHATYLAVDLSRSVHMNQVKNHGRKDGNAGKGVNLPKLLISPRVLESGKRCRLSEDGYRIRSFDMVPVPRCATKSTWTLCKEHWS